MKKQFAFIVMAAITFAALFSIPANALTTACDVYYGYNKETQNYDIYSRPIYSALTKTADGNLMRFQAFTDTYNYYIAEYFDSSYNYKKTVKINKELPIFGAFYETSSNYYILSGQENPNESSSVECFRLTKYDKSWKRLSSCGLKNCRTVYPFYMGCPRIASVGKYLIVETSHKLYKLNGVNHQSNATIEFDTNAMKITDYSMEISNKKSGFTSHSFNQFLGIDNGKLITVNHCDGYDRAITMIKYNGSNPASGTYNCEGDCIYTDLYSFPGKIGENYTGASVGGFEITKNNYIVAANSVHQNSSFSTNKTRNIFLTITPRATGSSFGTTTVKWLTSYAEGSESATTPQLISLGSDTYMVMWSVGSKVYYTKINGSGSRLTSIYNMNGNLSACKPIVYNGKLVWYVWSNNEVVFYDINISNPAKTNSVSHNTGHNLKFISENKSTGVVTSKCSKCGKTITQKLPKSFTTLWRDDAVDKNLYYGVYRQELNIGNELRIWSYFPGGDYDNSDLTITVSNPSVVKYTAKRPSNTEGTFKMLKNGSTTVKVELKYNPNISKTFTINVGHNYISTVVKPTCTEKGYTLHTCSICGNSYKNTYVDALGHNMTAWAIEQPYNCTDGGNYERHCERGDKTEKKAIAPKDHVYVNTIIEPTCNSRGYTLHKCSVCGSEYKDSYKAPLEHVYVDTIVKPTCTERGYTLHKCKLCGSEYKDSYVSILDHVYQDTVIAPTCNSRGYTLHKCNLCGSEYKDSYVTMLDHIYTDSVVAPTCTERGYTLHKCKLCGSEYKDSYVALLDHVYKDTVIAPTCTERGYTLHQCTVCGSEYKDNFISRLQHKYVETAVAPTCTKQGYTLHKCTLCGYSVKSDYTEPLGHKFSEWDVTKTATCTTDGTKTRKCSVCGTAETQTIKAEGHKLSAWTTVRSPSCTQQGLKKSTCSVCGQSMTQSIAMTAHTYTTSKVSPTCTQRGYTLHTCKVCGYQYKDSYTAAIKHSYTTKVVKPTCTAKGYTLYTCKNCSYQYKGNIVNASGHKYINKTVSPTYTSQGYTLHKCSVCGYSYKNNYKPVLTLKPVTNLKAVPKTNSVILSWNRVSKATGYYIYRYNTQSKKYIKIKTVKSNSCVISNLSSGTGYKFRVYAYKSSEISKPVSITTSTRPANVKFTITSSSNKAVIKWNKVSRATGYKVYYKTSKNGPWKLLKVTTGTSYTKTNLIKGKTYYFTVKAYKKYNGKTYNGYFTIKPIKIK